MEIVTFDNPYKMAQWIKANIKDENKQETLMYLGVLNKKINGTYTIKVS